VPSLSRCCRMPATPSWMFDPVDAQARRHDVARPPVTQPEDLLDDLVLDGGHVARLRGLLDERADLLLGRPLLPARPEPERREHQVGRARQQLDDGRSQTREPPSGAATTRAIPSGSWSARALGTSSPMTSERYVMALTTRPKRHGLPIPRDLRVAAEPLRERLRERGAAVGPGKDPDERDAHLHGGEQDRGVGLQREHLGRPAVPGVGPLLQPHPARGNDRDLRHREDAVDEHKHEDDDDLAGHGRPPCG